MHVPPAPPRSASPLPSALVQPSQAASDPVLLLQESLRECLRHPALLALLLRLSSAEGIPNPLHQAMSAGDPTSAGMLLSVVQRLAEEQYLTPEQERRLLIDAMDDAALMHPDLFDAWLLSVDAAAKAGRMATKQAFKVITRRGHDSTDALQWVCGGCKAGALRGWVGLVSRARRLGVIERDIGLRILRALLLARSDGRRADIVGVSATAKQRLLETVDHLLDCQLIDTAEAARLSREIAEAIRGISRGTPRKGVSTVVG